MGIPNPSAGVYVHETDASQVAKGASSSIGVIVGESNRGPAGVTQLITNTKQFLDLYGIPDARISYMHYAALAFLEHGSRLYVTRVAPGALLGGATVYSSGNLNVSQSWAAGQSQKLLLQEDLQAGNPTMLKEFASTDLFHLYAVDPGAWNNDITVVLYPNTRSDDGTFYVEVFLKGRGISVEKFLVSLDFVLDGYGVQLNIQEHINNRSMYIKVAQNYDHASYVADPSASFINTLNSVAFKGGSNPRKATSGELIQGWELYSDTEQIDINILINGGYSIPEIQKKMIEICEDRMDCMAILDTPSLQQSVSTAISYRRDELNANTSYAALYSPDYLIQDQYNDLRLYIPPSGHVAGAYARTDSEYALWFAPAGMARGRLNILGVRHIYGQGDRDSLYDSQINATRVIKGAGIRIWGADTLQTMTSALSNVSVRRLMIYLEKSLGEAALYSVFDPNDYILRAKLVEICERFLNPIKNSEGLYSYSVVCDETNNLPATIAAGDLMLDIYCDPTLPAKQIHLTAVVNRTGAKFVNS